MQLTLPFYARGSLREAIEAYLRECAEYVADATLVDYGERARWLMHVFGELTPLVDINHETLRRVERAEGPRGRGLMLSTIKKRFAWLLAAMKLAAARGIIRMDQVPPMPKIASDAKRKDEFITLGDYKQLRLALQGRVRTLVDLGMWTGMHRSNLYEVKRWMLEPDHEWKDADGKVVWTGRWLRTNTKNKRCKPIWMPSEPEFVPIMKEILAEHGHRESLVVGRVSSYGPTIKAASDRIGISPVSLMGLRHSIATLLLERTHDYEYVRLFLGHEGELIATPDMRYAGTGDPTTLSRHYLGASTDTMLSAVVRRFEPRGPVVVDG